MGDWLRVRFYVSDEDPRPVEFPPPGPYWVTGQTLDHGSILVAYVCDEDDVERYWPGAEIRGIDERQEIRFTDRFPKPDWWQAPARPEGE